MVNQKPLFPGDSVRGCDPSPASASIGRAGTQFAGFPRIRCRKLMNSTKYFKCWARHLRRHGQVFRSCPTTRRVGYRSRRRVHNEGLTQGVHVLWLSPCLAGLLPTMATKRPAVCGANARPTGGGLVSSAAAIQSVRAYHCQGRAAAPLLSNLSWQIDPCIILSRRCLWCVVLSCARPLNGAQQTSAYLEALRCAVLPRAAWPQDPGSVDRVHGFACARSILNKCSLLSLCCVQCKRISE